MDVFTHTKQACMALAMASSCYQLPNAQLQRKCQLKKVPAFPPPKTMQCL